MGQSRVWGKGLQEPFLAELLGEGSLWFLQPQEILEDSHPPFCTALEEWVEPRTQLVNHLQAADKLKAGVTPPRGNRDLRTG